MRIAILLAFVLLAPTMALGQDGGLPGPYQIDGVAQFLGGEDTAEPALELARPYVVVDLGDAEDAPFPDMDQAAGMTVIGTRAAALGSWYEIRKSCSYLCGGGEGATCHYTALVTLDRPVEEIGTPLAAIEGRHELSNFRGVDAVAAAPEAAPPQAWLGGGMADLFVHSYSGGVHGYAGRLDGWDPDTGAAAVAYRWSDSPANTLDGAQCAIGRSGALVSMNCGSFALLGSDRRPLILSFQDYGPALADVVAAFGADGSTYYLVRLGMKAQIGFGLLVNDGEGWRFRLRDRDYPRLC